MLLPLQPNELKRAPDDVDFSDLTDAEQTGPAFWDPEQADALVIPFDPEPSEAEQAAIARRLLSVDDAAEAEVAQWQAAFAGLEGDTSPMGVAMRAFLADKLGSLAH